MELQKLTCELKTRSILEIAVYFGLPRGHVQRYSEAENERLLEPPNSTLAAV